MVVPFVTKVELLKRRPSSGTECRGPAMNASAGPQQALYTQVNAVPFIFYFTFIYLFDVYLF